LVHIKQRSQKFFRKEIENREYRSLKLILLSGQRNGVLAVCSRRRPDGEPPARLSQLPPG